MAGGYNVNYEVDYKNKTKTGRKSSACFGGLYAGLSPDIPIKELRIYYKEGRVEPDVVPMLIELYRYFRIKAEITQDGPDYEGQWMIKVHPRFNTPIEIKIATTFSRYLDEERFPGVLRKYEEMRDKRVNRYRAFVFAHALHDPFDSHHSLLFKIKPEAINYIEYGKKLRDKNSKSIHITMGGSESDFQGGFHLNEIREKIAETQNLKTLQL